jgi:hypothetical protein
VAPAAAKRFGRMISESDSTSEQEGSFRETIKLPHATKLRRQRFKATAVLSESHSNIQPVPLACSLDFLKHPAPQPPGTTLSVSTDATSVKYQQEKKSFIPPLIKADLTKSTPQITQIPESNPFDLSFETKEEKKEIQFLNKDRFQLPSFSLSESSDFSLVDSPNPCSEPEFALPSLKDSAPLPEFDEEDQSSQENLSEDHSDEQSSKDSSEKSEISEEEFSEEEFRPTIPAEYQRTLREPLQSLKSKQIKQKQSSKDSMEEIPKQNSKNSPEKISPPLNSKKSEDSDFSLPKISLSTQASFPEIPENLLPVSSKRVSPSKITGNSQADLCFDSKNLSDVDSVIASTSEDFSSSETDDLDRISLSSTEDCEPWGFQSSNSIPSSKGTYSEYPELLPQTQFEKSPNSEVQTLEKTEKSPPEQQKLVSVSVPTIAGARKNTLVAPVKVQNKTTAPPLPKRPRPASFWSQHAPVVGIPPAQQTNSRSVTGVNRNAISDIKLSPSKPTLFSESRPRTSTNPSKPSFPVQTKEFIAPEPEIDLSKIPISWRVMKLRQEDQIPNPVNRVDIPLGANPGSPSSLISRQSIMRFLQSVDISKVSLGKLEKSQKSLLRLQQRHEAELLQMKEKCALRLKSVKPKVKSENVKIKAQAEKQYTQSQKLALKNLLTPNPAQLTQDIEKTLAQVNSSAREKWLELAKTTKASQAERYSALELELKDSYQKKARHKYSYTKKVLSPIKAAMKIELLLRKKFDLLELASAKANFDANTSLLLHDSRLEVIRSQRNLLNESSLEHLMESHWHKLEKFNFIADKMVASLLEALHEEESIIKERHQFEYDQLLRRFRAEEEHQNLLISLLADKGLDPAIQTRAQTDLSELSTSHRQHYQDLFEIELNEIQFKYSQKIIGLCLDAAKRRVHSLGKFHSAEREMCREHYEVDRTELYESQLAYRQIVKESFQAVLVPFEQGKADLYDTIRSEPKLTGESLNALSGKVDNFLQENLAKLAADKTRTLDRLRIREESERNALKDKYATLAAQLTAKFEFSKFQFMSVLKNLPPNMLVVKREEY